MTTKEVARPSFLSSFKLPGRRQHTIHHQSGTAYCPPVCNSFNMMSENLLEIVMTLAIHLRYVGQQATTSTDPDNANISQERAERKDRQEQERSEKERQARHKLPARMKTEHQTPCTPFKWNYLASELQLLIIQAALVSATPICISSEVDETDATSFNLFHNIDDDLSLRDDNSVDILATGLLLTNKQMYLRGRTFLYTNALNSLDATAFNIFMRRMQGRSALRLLERITVAPWVPYYGDLKDYKPNRDGEIVNLKRAWAEQHYRRVNIDCQLWEISAPWVVVLGLLEAQYPKQCH